MEKNVIEAKDLSEMSVFEHLYFLIEKAGQENYFSDGEALEFFYKVVSDFDSDFQRFNNQENDVWVSIYNQLLEDCFLPIIDKIYTSVFDKIYLDGLTVLIKLFTYLIKLADDLVSLNDLIDNICSNLPFYKTTSDLNSKEVTREYRKRGLKVKGFRILFVEYPNDMLRLIATYLSKDTVFGIKLNNFIFHRIKFEKSGDYFTAVAAF